MRAKKTAADIWAEGYAQAVQDSALGTLGKADPGNPYKGSETRCTATYGLTRCALKDSHVGAHRDVQEHLKWFGGSY